MPPPILLSMKRDWGWVDHVHEAPRPNGKVVIEIETKRNFETVEPSAHASSAHFL
jgi:hypothetical protein